MNYVSVCSGIEAATMAWHDMGWKPLAFSEIEKFPSAVLAHHYPDVTNEGDFTTIGDKYDLTDGLLVGGTPCQSFSVAGLRKGMDDDRGNLALEFLKLARDSRAKWVVWENVPGVLSSNGGRDFGAILGGLAQLGYGWAYRVLDAQYFGVAQRRRRVFVVGHLGNWQRAAAVLFEQASLSGHTPPSREKGERVAGDAEGGVGIGSQQSYRVNTLGGVGKDCGGVETECAGSLSAQHCLSPKQGQDAIAIVEAIPEVCGCLSDGAHNGGGLNGQDAYSGRIIPAVCFEPGILKREGNDSRISQEQCSTLRADMGDNQPAVCMPINSMTAQGRPSDDGRMGSGIGEDGDPQNTLSSAHHHAVCINKRPAELSVKKEIAHTLRATDYKDGLATISHSQVRRLTPIECERLQGFPDNFTQIPWRGKDIEDCPDGPRYKALGNSMAVPVMRWIGERIQSVEEL